VFTQKNVEIVNIVRTSIIIIYVPIGVHRQVVNMTNVKVVIFVVNPMTPSLLYHFTSLTTQVMCLALIHPTGIDGFILVSRITIRVLHSLLI
jgi:uncharacterized membrane protein YjdF